MPRGDGTGPRGPGPGRGMGQSSGRAVGRGQMGGRELGTGGGCVCPDFGHRVAHKIGTPGSDLTCPPLREPDETAGVKHRSRIAFSLSLSVRADREAHKS